MSMHECPHAHIPSHSPTPSHMQLSCMKTVFKTKAFCFKSTGPPPNIKPLDHLREPLIGQPSDRVHWTNLQYNLLDNPPNYCYRTTLRISNHWTISENPLLDNPPIGFIGQTSNIIYWTTLRYNLLDNPPM